MEKTINRKEEIENQIIDLIILGAGGRLIAFKPENDLNEIDLIVEKRNRYEASIIEKRGGFSIRKGKTLMNLKPKEEGIFFKIVSSSGHIMGSNFIADIVENKLAINNDLYLIFVHFDEVKGQINDLLWVVPSIDFKNIADQVKSAKGEVLLRFESLLDVNIKNKYSKYLVDKKDIGRYLLEVISKK